MGWGRGAGSRKGSVSRFISQDSEEAFPSLAEQAVHSPAQCQLGQPQLLLRGHEWEEFGHQDLKGQG